MGNADELLGRILSSGPSQGTLHVVLLKLKEEGRHRELIPHALKALNVYPRDIVIRGILAEAYLKTGFLGQAESELARVAAELEPLMSAFKLQAELYALQNRRQEASDALKRYLAHHAGDREALDLMAKLRSSRMQAVSRTQPDTEEGTPPGRGDPPPELATPTLAEIYYSQGRVQDAIRTYEEFLRQNPVNRVAAERLTELKAMAGHALEADASEPEESRTRKEKVISILESWLEKIREPEHR